MRTLSVLALALCAGVLGACSSGNPPTFSVLSAEVTQRSDEGTLVSIDIQADNPNADPLPLPEVQYEVFIDGRRAFAGTRSPQTTLRAFGRQSFTIPAAIEGDVPEGAPFRVSGQVRYQPPGAWRETLTDMGFGLPTSGLNGDGVVGKGSTGE